MGNLKNILKRLNFNSWFDLWHTHIDWDGKGNKSWIIRKKFIKDLFTLYEALNTKMIKNNRKYQSWCSINLDDSYYDAVYLHTKNPNEKNYPCKMEKSNRKFGCKYPLIKFIEKMDLNGLNSKAADILLHTK